MACHHGHLGLVEKLLGAGACTARRNEPGFTPLMAAAAGGQLDVCNLLLDHEASVNSTGFVETSALSIACAGGFDELCRALVSRGAKLRNDEEDEPAADVLVKKGAGELLAELEKLSKDAEESRADDAMEDGSGSGGDGDGNDAEEDENDYWDEEGEDDELLGILEENLPTTDLQDWEAPNQSLGDIISALHVENHGDGGGFGGGDRQGQNEESEGQ